MELLGFVSCAGIGISLGLFGAGGSILMVPVLVFLFHMTPLAATSYSLFVVGFTSLLAAGGKFRRGDLLLRPALAFGLSSMIVVLVIRHYLIPIVPKYLLQVGNVPVTYNEVSMILFSGLMIFAALAMIKTDSKVATEESAASINLARIFPYALATGVVTGFLGAGGGFLIIPVLTLWLGLGIKKAVGTSLAIITINSLCGFLADIGHTSINWTFLAIISLIAVVGSLAGAVIADKINSKKLKVYFGWFVLSLGIIIMATESYQILILC